MIHVCFDTNNKRYNLAYNLYLFKNCFFNAEKQIDFSAKKKIISGDTENAMNIVKNWTS